MNPYGVIVTIGTTYLLLFVIMMRVFFYIINIQHVYWMSQAEVWDH